MKAKQMRAGAADAHLSRSGGDLSGAGYSVPRAVESERTRQHERLDLILHAISDAIVAADPQGRVVFANAAAASAWGLPSADEMVATPVRALIARFDIYDEEGRCRLTPDELPGAEALSGRAATRLVRFRRAGSTEDDRWALIQSTPALGPRGDVQYAINIFRDVTERETAARRERFLGEASAILSASLNLETALQGMAEHATRSLAEFCAVDMYTPGRGAVRRVATAHRDSSRRRLAERIAELYPVDLESPTGVAAVLRGGRTEVHAALTDQQLSILAPDPEHRALLQGLGLRSIALVPMIVRGETIGVVTLGTGDGGPRFGAGDLAIAEELARRASVSADNARLHAEAQDALRSREDLLAIVSHDLRNPLGVILTSSALLLRAALPPDKGDRARRQVEAIQRAGNRMNRLIRDLLDLATIQGGQLLLTRRTQSAASLGAEAVESLRPLAVQKSQRLEVELPDPALPVYCDRDRVTQVLSNVIGNAIKFAPEGGLIRVSVLSDGAMVRFTVVDDGPGMNQEELQHMYDRYWQAKRKNREGIGLGLSIVKGIVDRHGGRVWAESTVGQGTTVHFTIPAVPPL